MGQEKGMGLHCNCCLVYVFLCILSCRISTGVISLSKMDEEWEVVFPSLWGSQERAKDGRTIVEPVFQDAYKNQSSEDLPSSNNQAAISSREVRSVSSLSPTPSYFHQQMDRDEEQYDEQEDHELHRFASFPWLSEAKTVNTSSSSITSRSGKFNSSSGSIDHNGKIKLKISAFGKDLYLLLKKDNRFLSPSFVVEERKRDKKESLNVGNTDRDCYYSGTVLGHRGSFASFSTCGGLMGFIQMNEDFIYIEPVNGTLAEADNAHKVYRTKRTTDDKTTGNRTSSHKSHCGVTDKRRTKNYKGTETGRGKRYSYKQNQEYNIETVVVADPAMVSYHGSEATRKFILTILNMVYNLFQHKSLGVQMNLRVTKLILLHETPADMYIGHHGEKMLESFCKWQLDEFGKKNDVHMEMTTSWSDEYSAVDAAVLITRTDFCVHKDEPCDTVGIAYLNGMCSDKRKCIIAEDNGLNLAFTIAHEMGHNMGINHDNDHPSCADGLHIMSGEWIKGQNLGDVSWSRCSREDLEKFLRSKASNCLLQTNPQSISSVIIPSKLPGMTYTADEQCQILFGPTASFCQEMQHVICTGLWCKLESEIECRTRLDPPMDGTECGTEKWCRVGECTSMTSSSEHLSGEWSSWSSCSRTCGAGVRSRQRNCLSQSTEGRQCNDPKIQYKMCENPRCPPGVTNFRDWQCQTFSFRSSYHKQKHRWHSVINEEKPCALFCSALGKDHPVLVAEKALDGTACGPDGLDMCSNGRCQKVGCDGVLGSLSREDHCGVCNGNGKSCRVIKGDFNHTRGAESARNCLAVYGMATFPSGPRTGGTCYSQNVHLCFPGRHSANFPPCEPGLNSSYVEALVIPAGARRIKVVEETPAHSYLALRDTGKQSINDDWKIEEPGTFYMAGTTVNYIRRGLWEKISAKGPTTTPLHLLVLLFNDQNYGLHYEYTIPLDPGPENRSAKLNEPLYMWTHSGWEDCDAVCGGGERRTTVSCTKIMNKNITVVDNASCKDLLKPEPQIRKCNEQPCQTRWMMTEWSPCSRTCGKGTQTRQTACTQQLRNGTVITVRERDCPTYKPASSQRCEGQDCMTVWEAGVWSECSLKCGKGVRHRTVRCTNPLKKCLMSTRPREMEDCEDYSKCYIWRTGDWSKCSVTCGKGMQSRVIQCMHRITGRHGNECFSSEKPAAYRPCHLQACNEKVNVNTITSPRLAALTFKCLQDQWPVYCKVIREKNLCQDMRWYQRCCETCRDFYAQKMQHRS